MMPLHFDKLNYTKTFLRLNSIVGQILLTHRNIKDLVHFASNYVKAKQMIHNHNSNSIYYNKIK